MLIRTKHQSLTLLFLVLYALNLQAAKKPRPWEKVVPGVPIAYTHLLQSTQTVPHLNLILGSTIGIGFFNRLELTSNLYKDVVSSTFNANAKISIFSNENFGFASYLGYYSQGIRTFFISSVTQRRVFEVKNVTSLNPGAVISGRILKNLTAHFGGGTHIRSPNIDKDELDPATSFIQGTNFNLEFTYGINPDLAISAGPSYDQTFNYTGFGASAHLGTLQLGAHFYFGVNQGVFVPLASGYFSTDLE